MNVFPKFVLRKPLKVSIWDAIAIVALMQQMKVNHDVLLCAMWLCNAADESVFQ